MQKVCLGSINEGDEMIEFKDVTKRYGGNVAVDNVSFKINEA